MRRQKQEPYETCRARGEPLYCLRSTIFLLPPERIERLALRAEKPACGKPLTGFR